MKYIEVMTIPGRSIKVEVDDNATVADCVEKAGMTLQGFSLTCTKPAEGATGSTVVEEGATICLTRQVKAA